ncbi:MAG: MBL fold metallo-hydrolase [Nocardioides sp.]|uniref:MBL fold metallo-hydrolase n=1 Tax=Nocardioides sp. TaxID=35761 RepID=UPI0039E5B7B5
MRATWWGHSFVTVEFPEGPVVATDPLLARRLFHLRRRLPEPGARALCADVIVVSHLHHDHLHLPSLRRFSPQIPLVVPAGAARAVPWLRGRGCLEVAAGDQIEVAGVTVAALPARHDPRRLPLPGMGSAPAIGFRLSHREASCWYPGDTGVVDFAAIEAVDLALVPIGGWGPSLGEEHLDPAQAVAAVAAVGARWVLPVHYGTMWPMLLERVHPASHRHFFAEPADRFRRAAAEQRLSAELRVPAVGELVEL